MRREQALSETFVELADTLVRDYDVHDFLHILATRCVEILDMAAVGVLLGDENGVLQLTAASNDDMRALELFQMQQHEGPCLDAFTSGRPVVEPDFRNLEGRWPTFGPAAVERRLCAVYAFPLRLRDDVIGSLNLFRSEPGEFRDDDVRAAQALADVASIGILQKRTVRRAEDTVEQLQHALHSRVVIEQAKGMVAHEAGTEVGQAFVVIRQYARRRGERLRDVAEKIVARQLAGRDLVNYLGAEAASPADP